MSDDSDPGVAGSDSHPELPLDSDLVAEDERAGPPVHLRPGYLLAVWLGGSLGTATRYLIGRAVPPLGAVPVATVGINVVGALVLGVLLEGLARSGPDRGRRRLARLAGGTGFLGGFTTYSALSVESVTLFRDGRVGSALGYALGTVALGAGAAALGILLAARGRRRRVPW